MRKLFVAIVFIGLSAFYVSSRAPHTSPITVSNAQDDTNNITVSPLPSVVTPPPPAPAPTPTPTPTKTGYKDGVYTGSVADAFYGLLQVQVIIKRGLINDIVFLAYPDDRENSLFINGQAMPILTEEAIEAQSADVDIISGATETSIAFKESLGVALAAAKI
jgi:uncharacterized protein with FMN-binding domain